MQRGKVEEDPEVKWQRYESKEHSQEWLCYHGIHQIREKWCMMQVCAERILKLTKH